MNFNGDIRHGGSKGFQPGSTYKPYVLLAFLAAGHGLNETFNASIRSTPMAKFQDSCNGPHGGPDYTYRNDSGEGGLYNAIRGTAGSVNSVFVQMAAEVDQCDIAKLAASIGVHAACGFQMIGTHPNVGLKFGRWLDTVMMQRKLGEGASTVPAAESGTG